MLARHFSLFAGNTSLEASNRYRGTSTPIAHAFSGFLYERPKIADYIRKLDYPVEVADLTSPSIQESLKRISRLEFLTICYRDISRLYWSNKPIRPALLHLLHLPTLTYFCVTDINNFPVSDLIPCINLKYLDIAFYTTGETETAFSVAFPKQSIQLNEFVAERGSADAIAKLCSTRRPYGEAVIDFGPLSKVTVALGEPDEVEASQELFRCCQLTTPYRCTDIL